LIKGLIMYCIAVGYAPLEELSELVLTEEDKITLPEHVEGKYFQTNIDFDRLQSAISLSTSVFRFHRNPPPLANRQTYNYIIV